MGFVVWVLGLLLQLLLFPAGFLVGVFYSFHRHRFRTGLKNLNKKFWLLAKSLDKYGNVVCMELFNITLIKKESLYKFGRIEQTISMVIGYNLLAGTLTPTGHWLNGVLNYFDPDHSLKAIFKDKTDHESIP